MDHPHPWRGVSVLAVTVVLAVTAAARGAEPATREAFAFAVELVQGSDSDLRAVALERLRDGLPGAAFTAELAERVLPALPPAVQVRLLSTLAARRDPAALPGIVPLADSGDEAVASAAVRAIAALGGGEQVPLIVARLAAAGPVAAAARDALATIQGPDVTPRLVAAAGGAGVPAASRGLILEVLAERRDRAAVPALVAAAVSDEPAVRAAAMRSLAAIGGAAEVPGLVAGLLAASPGAERAGAERAIVTVCRQGPEAGPAAAALLAAHRAADEGSQGALLFVLARVGGADVLAIADRLVADADPAARRRGLEILARWPDAAVTERILGLLEAALDEADRGLLVAALVRIAPLPDNGLSDPERLALLAKTMTLCTTDAERGRLLERAAAIRTVETLRFVRPHLDDEPLAESAAKGVVELAHHQKLRDADKAEFLAALDRVLAVSRDPITRERAERYKEGKTWERR